MQLQGRRPVRQSTTHFSRKRQRDSACIRDVAQSKPSIRSCRPHALRLPLKPQCNGNFNLPDIGVLVHLFQLTFVYKHRAPSNATVRTFSSELGHRITRVADYEYLHSEVYFLCLSNPLVVGVKSQKIFPKSRSH